MSTTEPGDPVFLDLTGPVRPGRGSDPNRPRLSPAPTGRAGRYDLGDELARGGMGAVLRGHDTALGRDLAIKVLLPDRATDPAALSRFLQEARVTARLQHPGIVPVHEVGRLSDGTPYFAMKLVEGHTLASLLAARGSPADDRPRLLGVFHQVSQTVAFAHSKGVIHRDLKPANVMVGAFGEVQVMDWGVAKDVSDQEAEVGVAFRPLDPSSSTLVGQVVGTPAYMAPEQARAARPDPRADVFGLGAILCEILTGSPPWGRGPTADVLSQLTHCGPSPRCEALRRSGADDELIRLAERCLAFEPGERPADAGEVARAMSTYLDGVQERVLAAERQQAAAEARAEEVRAKAAAERRARNLLIGSVVLGLLALSLLFLAWARVRAVRRQAAEAAARHEADITRQVEADLASAAQQRDEGRALARDLGRWEVTLARALAADRRAVARAGDRAALRERAEGSLSRTEQEDARRRFLAQLDRASQESGLVGRMAFDYARACRTYEAAFRAAGQTPFADPARRLAQWILQQPSGDILIEAVEDWAGLEADPARRGWLLAVAQEADPDPARVRLWRSVGTSNPEAVAAAVAGLKLDEQRPTTIELAARALVSLGRSADAVVLLKRGCETHPTSFKLHTSLGLTSTALPERLAHHTAAVALRRDSPGARLNLGVVYYDMSRLEEAERAYRLAIRLAPDFVLAYYNLAVTLNRLKRYDEAATVLRRAAELDPDNPEAPRALASNALDRRQPEEARCILWSSLCRRRPTGWELYTLGVAEEALGNLEVASELFQRSSETPGGKGIDFLVSKVRVLQDLRRDAEADALAYSLVRAPAASADMLGRLLPGLIGSNRHGPAEACARRLLRLEPGHARARDYLAHRAAADTPEQRLERALGLQERGRMEEAAALLDPLLAGGMTDPHLYVALARWHLDQGRVKDAEPLLTKACATDAPPDDAFAMLAQAKRKLGKFGEAATALDRADPKAPVTRLGRALLAVARGERDAVPALLRLGDEKTTDFPPDDCEDAAVVLANLGQHWHAANWLERTARAWPEYPRVQYQSAALLLQTERYEPAERALRAYAGLSPADPRGWALRGVALGHLGRFDEAHSALKHAQGLSPKMPKWSFPFDRVMAEVAAAQRLHPLLADVASGKVRPASDAQRLEWIEVCIQWLARPVLAARLAADAVREVPALTDAAGKKLLFLQALACCRAAAGRGDAGGRTPAEYATFRTQALAALRAEMDRCDKVIDKDAKAVAASLMRFRGVLDLWGIRGRLGALPEGEREGWKQAWGRFDELLKKAGATP